MRGTAIVEHADKVQAALKSSDAARSALVASWQRSSQHRLDPTHRSPPERLTQAELSLARLRIEPLISAAQASLDRLYLAVGGVGCCVLLADRDGVPVERRGAVADDETFHDWGLWTGTVWSEESEGTNAIGTSLVEQRPLTIHRGQHFLSRNTALSCTTAPVYDHQGIVAAALDVSSCRADLTEGFVNLIALAVGDAARRIEADNFRLAFPHARIILTHEVERGPGGMIAVDADDLVIGATRQARLTYGISRERLERRLPVADIVGGSMRAAEDLDEAERAALHRALARADGNVSAAAQQLGISRATLHRKLNRLGIRRTH
jgi:transcriptional regulator of acetoin/glycerol metabolism